jgi:hypothetical protein
MVVTAIPAVANRARRRSGPWLGGRRRRGLLEAGKFFNDYSRARARMFRAVGQASCIGAAHKHPMARNKLPVL